MERRQRQGENEQIGFDGGSYNVQGDYNVEGIMDVSGKIIKTITETRMVDGVLGEVGRTIIDTGMVDVSVLSYGGVSAAGAITIQTILAILKDITTEDMISYIDIITQYTNKNMYITPNIFQEIIFNNMKGCYMPCGIINSIIGQCQLDQPQTMTISNMDFSTKCKIYDIIGHIKKDQNTINQLENNLMYDIDMLTKGRKIIERKQENLPKFN